MRLPAFKLERFFAKIEEILVHAGAEEAVFIFMNVAFQAGDHLIVHSPCYQSHSSIAQSVGCEVSRWMGREANNWELDADVEKFCIDLVNQQGVLLLPSTYFDYGKQNFRIGLGRKNLPECIEKLDDYLKAIAA